MLEFQFIFSASLIYVLLDYWKKKIEILGTSICQLVITDFPLVKYLDKDFYGDPQKTDF